MSSSRIVVASFIGFFVLGSGYSTQTRAQFQTPDAKTCDYVESMCNVKYEQDVVMCQNYPHLHPNASTVNGVRDCYPYASQRYNRCIVETPCV
jgi:hypothetical protein